MEDEKLDGLSAEELAAANGGDEDVDAQHQIDRGDFLEDDDTAGAGAGDEAGKGADAGKVEGKQEGEDTDPLKKEGAAAGSKTDLEELEALAGGEEDPGVEHQVPSGMPYSRANEISREKNAANDLVAAMLAGTIDKRWVTDMGGQQAVVKGIAAGKIVLPVPAAGAGQEAQVQTVHPEIAKLETKLDDLNKQLAEATVNVNSEEMLSVQKQINAVNRDILRVENALIRQADVNQAREEAARQDESNVKAVMVDLWSKHPELHTDSNEYLAFMARRDFHLQQGKPMSQALKLAAEQTFPQSAADQGGKKTPAQIAEDRLTAARTKGAEAKAAQPPAGQAGAGTRAAAGQKSIEKLSDDEFDKLTDEEKARERGDII